MHWKFDSTTLSSTLFDDDHNTLGAVFTLYEQFKDKTSGNGSYLAVGVDWKGNMVPICKSSRRELAQGEVKLFAAEVQKL